MHRGDEKGAGGGALHSVAPTAGEVWLLDGCEDIFGDRSAALERPAGTLAKCQAHWHASTPPACRLAPRSAPAH